MKYNYTISGCAPVLYPADIVFALFYVNEDESVEMPKRTPFKADWGYPMGIEISEDEYPLPVKIDMVWLSLVEKKFYSLVHDLPVEKIFHYFGCNTNEETGSRKVEYIILGMAPNGGVAMWLHSKEKAVLVEWMHAEITHVPPCFVLPIYSNSSIEEYCDFYINREPCVRENLEKNGLPPRDLFENYMKQFTYRYMMLFEHWDKNEWKMYEEEETVPEFDYIEEALFDGTHDKLHDGGLMNYHQAGKPKKLAVKWHIKKSEYSAYFWFEDEEIRTVFDRFYGAHPETKTDFMIRIDSDNKKYELALYRYGLKEPQVISESAYQLLVFKNKFEYYRSENYNQLRGAWIW